MDKKNLIDMNRLIRKDSNVSNRLALTKVEGELSFININDNILTLLNNCNNYYDIVDVEKKPNSFKEEILMLFDNIDFIKIFYIGGGVAPEKIELDFSDNAAKYIIILHNDGQSYNILECFNNKYYFHSSPICSTLIGYLFDLIEANDGLDEYYKQFRKKYSILKLALDNHNLINYGKCVDIDSAYIYLYNSGSLFLSSLPNNVTYEVDEEDESIVL